MDSNSGDLFIYDKSNLMGQLGITESQLAGLLGVSLRTFAEWEQGKFSPKIERLNRLRDVVDLMELMKVAAPYYILQNIRTKMGEPDGEDYDGTIVFMEYINAYPNDVDWQARTREAIKDYEKESAKWTKLGE